MLKIPTDLNKGKGRICICIWNTSCVTFQVDAINVRGTPLGEPQLTRVSKSCRDAICHTGNRWKS